MLEQSIVLTNCQREDTCESMYNSLIEVLKKELAIYSELKDFIIKEKKMLTRPSLQELNDSNAVKENIILKARMLEEARTNILKKIARNLDIKTEGVRLMTLANYAVIEQRQQIEILRNELIVISQEINQMNDLNKNLLEASLTNVRGSVDLINSLLGNGQVYQESGKMKMIQRNGKLVHTEG